MAQQNLFLDLGQQSMLKIIRSARSHLNRENSLDEEKAQSRTSTGAGTLQFSGDRHPRRNSTSGAARSALGGLGRHRLSQSSRPALEQTDSENAAPEKPQQAPVLGSAVLGDVTNIVLAGEAESRSKPPLVGETAVYKPGPTESLAGLSALNGNSGTPNQQVDTDAQLTEDPQHVMEYMSDIFRIMQRDEGLHQASPCYLERQVHVNAKMRGILVDWLISVQQKYKLKAETLFLTVNILDRYLEQKTTARKYLQLVGVSALLIAAKFEEMYPPQIRDLVYVTDKAYSSDDIIKMEVSILTALDFKICSPTPMHFLQRYQSLNGCSEAHSCLAQYLLELGVPDYSMLKYGASCRAASAVFLSNKLLRQQPAWRTAAVQHSHFTEPMLKECAKEMCALLDNAETSSLQAARKKFSQLKYHSVAKLDFKGASPSSKTGAEPRCSIPRPTVNAGGAWSGMNACL